MVEEARQLNTSRYRHWLSPAWVAPASFARLISPERFIPPVVEFVKLFWHLDERVRIFGSVPEGPVYYVAEHRRFMDPAFMVDAVLDQTGCRQWPRYIMRDNLFRGTINSWAQKYTRVILIPRDDMKGSRERLKQTYRLTATTLNDRGAVAICPAATRSKDGSIYDVYAAEREDPLEKRIVSMAKRAASFLHSYEGQVTIAPVGVTFNDVSRKIYLAFGEPVRYTKLSSKADPKPLEEAVRQLACLKVVGLHHLLSYYFQNLPEHTAHIGDAYRDIAVALETFTKEHHHFDADLVEKRQVHIPESTMAQYLNYALAHDMLTKTRQEISRAVQVMDIPNLRKSAPLTYYYNEVKDVPGLKNAFSEVFSRQIQPGESRPRQYRQENRPR